MTLMKHNKNERIVQKRRISGAILILQAKTEIALPPPHFILFQQLRSGGKGGP